MHDYHATHRFAVEINTADPANGGKPTIVGFMLPKSHPEGEFHDGRLNLVRVEFGHNDADENSLTFYLPDGKTFRHVSLDDVDGDENETINRPLNAAWTGDEDSPLMHFVTECVAKTCLMFVTSSELERDAGIPMGETLDAMIAHTANARGFEKQNDGSMQEIGVGEEESHD